MSRFNDRGEPIGDAISDADRAEQVSRAELDAAHRAAIDVIQREADAQIKAVKFDLELERAGRRGDALVRDRLERKVEKLLAENVQLEINLHQAETRCSQAVGRVNQARRDIDERFGDGTFDGDF